MTSKLYKVTFNNDPKDFDIVRMAAELPVSMDSEFASLLSKLMPSKAGQIKARQATRTKTMSMIQADLIATSRKYNPDFENLPVKRCYSILVWGMKALPIKDEDLAKYAKAETKTPLFDQLMAANKGRKFDFTEESNG